MGLLDGGLSAIFGSAFAGVYLDGTLNLPGARVDDAEGVPTIAAPTPLGVKYQPERVTEAMRRDARYTDRDARFLILVTGPAGAVPRPTNAHTMTDKDGTVWDVVDSSTDPASGAWDVHATPKKGSSNAPAPEPDGG